MKTRLGLVILLASLLPGWSSCKKEIKQEVIPGDYQIRVLSSDTISHRLGEVTGIPLEIKLYRGNDEIAPNPEDYPISINNFICNTAGTGDAYYVHYGSDRIIRLNWYTGNTPGKQQVIITLKDAMGNILAQTETSCTVTENASGWNATCSNEKGILLTLAGQFWRLSEYTGVTRSKDGQTWEPANFPVYEASAPYHDNAQFFSAEKNGILYVTTTPDPATYLPVLFRSVNGGNSWEEMYSFNNASTRVLAVLDQEKVVISSDEALYILAKNDSDLVYGKTLIAADYFTAFTPYQNRFYALDHADMYVSETLTGNYNKLNTGFDIQHLWVDAGVLYLFSGNNIYRMENDGLTPEWVSKLPWDKDYRVLKVVRTTDRYYIAYQKSASIIPDRSYAYMISTKDWNSFTPEIKLKQSSFYTPNMVSLENACLIQQSEGFYHVQ